MSGHIWFFRSLATCSMLLGVIICLSAAHWPVAWVGMELNLLGFVAFMLCSPSAHQLESVMQYFLIQAMGAMLVLFAGCYNYLQGTWAMEWNSSWGILLGLLLKIGVAPMHFWVPHVVAGSSWLSVALLLTLQKVAPLYLLSSFFIFYGPFLLFVCLLSAIVAGVGGLNQSSLRALLGYSSIAHSGWLVAISQFSPTYCSVYFIVYSLLSLMLIFMFSTENLGQGDQINTLYNWSLFHRLVVSILFLSLGGLPPLIGFAIKAAILFFLLKMGLNSLSFILILGSIWTFFFYLRFSILILLSRFCWKEVKSPVSLKGSLVIFFNLLGGPLLMML